MYKELTSFLTRQGAGRFKLNKAALEKIPVLAPPAAEQTKIAQILSTWDKAIATSERLLANSQQQKQALMQQLLTGQKRFARFTADWKHYALGQLFNERNETNRPDLSLLSITTEQGVIDRADSGKKDTSSEDKSKYRRICPGDIGYNTMRMWQGVSGLSDKEGIVSPAYTILQPTNLTDSKFASYLFKTPTLIHVFMRHSQGLVSDTWNLKYEHFAKIKVLVPSLPEQQKIAQVLTTADAEIANLQAQLAKLKLEKKALMQQLLTGQRRVRVAAAAEQEQAVPA
ncbi:restriction endonuclease subunit S [Pseudomonas sp. 2FE]|uniref:restriction endonuclease subunit S n=1 Tax=Pseudomonas sp. 2FE TaxID=2502190 RepID=UPI0010F67191|nr:restriction endonuclease subunit S [Pseudomonas sp. 2FE]